MFVSSIDVKEFQGIHHCKTPLNLSNFTVLIGRNNSGKSSVLEALSLLPIPIHPVKYTEEDRLRFLEKLHGGRSSMIYGYSGDAFLTYRVCDKTWVLKIGDDGNWSLEIDGVTNSNVDYLVAGALGVPKQGDFISEINKQVFFIPNDTGFMNTLASKSIIDENWNLITKIGAHASVTKELINKCIDDNYTEILSTPELKARKERGEGKPPLYVKVKDLGDGIQKVVLTALWLEAIKPSLVLWDDFEGSAHPTLIKTLLEWLGKKKWQVVMSTHSIDVLTSLLEVRPKDASVLLLKKTNDDVLLHEDLALKELEDIIETSQDPRRLVDALKL